ncbi:hypothetical protein D3C73_1093650 [compost metagenome]
MTAVFHLGRLGMLADRHAGAGGIQQRHGLVRQLACRDVAMRQAHGGVDCLIEQQHAVVLFQRADGAAQHQQRFVFARFMHLHHLETAGQRRIFLNVFFVFRPGSGPDGT